jgi:hypothetical protein
MIIRLPNGLIDGQDWFNYAEIGELTGRQQNYLANKELVVGNIGHVPKILEDLILNLQTQEGFKWKGNISDVLWKLPVGDLEMLLIKIREKTYGSRFYHEAECTHCKKINKNLRLDIDKLEVVNFTIEQLLQSKKVILNKSQVEVELKPFYLKDIFEIIKIGNNKQDTLITSIVALSLKRYGNKSPVSEKDIESMPVTDIMQLQEVMENTILEGHIDTDITITCEGCKQDFNTKLNVYDIGFFTPIKGSTNTK